MNKFTRLSMQYKSSVYTHKAQRILAECKTQREGHKISKKPEAQHIKNRTIISIILKLLTKNIINNFNIIKKKKKLLTSNRWVKAFIMIIIMLMVTWQFPCKWLPWKPNTWIFLAYQYLNDTCNIYFQHILLYKVDYFI